MSRSAASFDAIRAHCLAKPRATLDHPWGEFAFKVGGKMFAVTGNGSPLRITVKAKPEDQAALCTHPAIERAAYVGRFGWVTVTVTNKETLRLALDLVDASYLLVAPRGEERESGNAAPVVLARNAAVTGEPGQDPGARHLSPPRGSTKIFVDNTKGFVYLRPRNGG